MNQTLGKTGRKVDAYTAGKRAWEEQLPRTVPDVYVDPEERLKWLAGWDAARDESLRG